MMLWKTSTDTHTQAGPCYGFHEHWWNIKEYKISVKFCRNEAFCRGSGSFYQQSVVSSPPPLRVNCLCTGQCWHGVAMSSLVPCWFQPCPPDLASQLDLWPTLSPEICLVIREQLARPALLPCWGTMGLWLVTDDAVQSAWLSPSAPGSLPLEELPALTTSWQRG